MESITVCVLGAAPEARAKVAAALGRKGSVSDMTFYNSKRSRITTVIEPTRFPEKIQPLCYALQMADHVLMVYDGAKTAFGECLVAAVSLKKPMTFLLSAQNSYLEDELNQLIKSAGCVGTKTLVYGEDFELVELVDRLASSPSEGELVVPVDAAFDVKGIGTVVLGFVQGADVKKHDELVVARSGDVCTVKSIQMQDDDYDSAPSGSRVGLALRGVKSEDLKRGDVLCAKKMELVSKLENLQRSTFYRGEPSKVHVSVGFQFVPAKLEGSTVELDSPIIKHGPALVLDLEAKQRVAGVVS